MKPGFSDERRSALCDWARANGLDPENIGEHIELIGDRIHYRELVDTRDGIPIWEERTAPLLADIPVDTYRLSTRPGVVSGGQ